MNDTYPYAPGFKAPDTSAAAAIAETERADVIREQVLRILAHYIDSTADEAAALLGLSVLSVRPRFSELKAQGKIEKTSARRANASGHMAIAWRLARRYEQPELV